MKHCISYAILLLVFVASSCKNYLGIYCSPPNYTAFCYELKKNNEFHFSESSCTFAFEGVGKYKITGDTIKFNFRPYNIKTGKYTLNKTQDIKDSIMVNLTVIDTQTRKPLAYYSAAIIIDNELIGGQDGDVNGRAMLIVPIKKPPIKIEISYTGYEPLDITINEPGIYTVLAEMNGGRLSPINWNEERFYRLIKLDKDSLVIRSFEDDGWQWKLARYEKKGQE